jgi:hypothetical protein
MEIKTYQKNMYIKWATKYKQHLDRIFFVMNQGDIINTEFEIYYTTNHNHEISYINDLLNFKQYL